MLKTLAIFALLLLVSATYSAQVAKELVGKYQMDVQGGDILELRANGTAAMAGDETQWSARGNQLSVGPDVMQYLLQGDRLVLTMGSVQIVWKKIGGAGKGPSLMQKAAAKAKARQPEMSEADADREGMAEANAWLGQQGNTRTGRPPMPSAQHSLNSARGIPGVASAAGGNAQDVQARQLLTSTAWCAFTYNKVSGTSTTRKVIFRRDGVMSVNGGAETYSSGYGGAYAGQSNTAGAMLWKLENLRLLVDQRDGAGFQDIGLNATKNSNGYVILHAEGREYSMCN